MKTWTTEVGFVPLQDPLGTALTLGLLGGVITVLVDQIRPRGMIVFNRATAALLGATIGTCLGGLIYRRSRSPRSIAVGLFGGAASGLAVALMFRAWEGSYSSEQSGRTGRISLG